MMDAICGPLSEKIESDINVDYSAGFKGGFRQQDQTQHKPAGQHDAQPDRWPQVGDTTPFVTSGNYTHSILHPLQDAAAAEIVAPMVRCRSLPAGQA